MARRSATPVWSLPTRHAADVGRRRPGDDRRAPSARDTVMRRSRSVSAASGVMWPRGASSTVLPTSSSRASASVMISNRFMLAFCRRSCPEPRVLISADTIAARIRELAQQIDSEYPPDARVHMVCVLKGGFIFLADLVRHMSPRVTLDFIAVSSYAKGTTSSGEVRFLKDLDEALDGKRRDHRRGHRRHRPDAQLPAGDPARPRTRSRCAPRAC